MIEEMPFKLKCKLEYICNAGGYKVQCFTEKYKECQIYKNLIEFVKKELKEMEK